MTAQEQGVSEFFEIVDENDQVIGTALRSECHGNPKLVHRVAHVLGQVDVFRYRPEQVLLLPPAELVVVGLVLDFDDPVFHRLPA